MERYFFAIRHDRGRLFDLDGIPFPSRRDAIAFARRMSLRIQKRSLVKNSTLTIEMTTGITEVIAYIRVLPNGVARIAESDDSLGLTRINPRTRNGDLDALCPSPPYGR